MRTFELLTLAATLAYLLWLSFGSALPGSAFRWLPGVAAALAAAQLGIEGPRWQLGPLYLLIALELGSYPWCRSRGFRLRLRVTAAVWGVAAVLVGVVTVTGGVFWPVIEFAPLTGPFAAGTSSAHLTDRSRRDPYSPAGLADRELMIQLWYPAETARGARLARYRDGRQVDYRDASLALSKTRSYLDAPLSRRLPRFPVLLFTGPVNRFQNTYETEELASHGFIVVALDHPYDSDLIVYPDGHRIARGQGAVLLDMTSDAALARSRKLVEQRLAVRVADVEFVLAQLALWNRSANSRFFGRFDMDHIGMIGHSFGGAVTAEVCRIDPRVRAGLNMDGSIFGTVKYTGIPKPYFVLFDPVQRPTTRELRSADPVSRRRAHENQGDFADVDRSLARYGGYFMQAPGLEHMNFTDCVLYTQVKAWTGAGTINARRAHQLITAVTLAFFRRELLHDPSASVEAELRNYPEAVLRRQAAPQPNSD